MKSGTVGGKGGALPAQQAGSRGEKIHHLEVEKKEKEEQRHGRAPGCRRITHSPADHTLPEQGPCSPL